MEIVFDVTTGPGPSLHYSTPEGWREFPVSEGKSAGILAALSALLRETKTPLALVTGLVVRLGDGRFTVIRLAVTVANTLAYALNIPVAAVPGDAELADCAGAIAAAKKGEYIAAAYRREPRLGPARF